MTIYYGRVTVETADGETNPVPIEQPIVVNASSVDPLADTVLWATQYMKDLDPLTQSQIVGCNATFPINLPSSGIKTSPVAGSSATIGGLMIWRTLAAIGSKAFSQWIPNFITAAFIGNNNQTIDPTNTHVTTLAAYLAGTSDNITGTDKAGNSINSFRRGQQAVRKLRRIRAAKHR